MPHHRTTNTTSQPGPDDQGHDEVLVVRAGQMSEALVHWPAPNGLIYTNRDDRICMRLIHAHSPIQSAIEVTQRFPGGYQHPSVQ